MFNLVTVSYCLFFLFMFLSCTALDSLKRNKTVETNSWTATLLLRNHRLVWSFFSYKKCHSSYKTRWTNDNSRRCSDGIHACTRNDRCLNGRCIGTPFTCLLCEECYNDVCRVKPGYCTIMVGGVKTCFSHGNLRPGYPCQVIIMIAT